MASMRLETGFFLKLLLTDHSHARYGTECPVLSILPTLLQDLLSRGNTSCAPRLQLSRDDVCSPTSQNLAVDQYQIEARLLFTRIPSSSDEEWIPLNLVTALSGDRGPCSPMLSLSDSACKGMALPALVLTPAIQLPRSANLPPSTYPSPRALPASTSRPASTSSSSPLLLLLLLPGSTGCGVDVRVLVGAVCFCHRFGTKVVYMVWRKWLVVPKVKSPRALAKALGISNAASLMAFDALRSGAEALAVCCMDFWPEIWMMIVSISNKLVKTRISLHKYQVNGNRPHKEKRHKCC